MKALEEHGKQLLKYNIEKEPLMPSTTKKEIFEEFAKRRMGEIQDFSKQIAFNN